MTLIERCERSRVLNAELYDTIARHVADSPRHSLVLAATSLAHEHHSAISKLSMTNHYGSATAMLRPQVEATITAAWALYVPKDDLINSVLLERANLPKPGTMMRQLDARPELKGKFELRTFYEGPGTILHKFTHGDMIQLQRRFGTGFSDGEKIAAVRLADFFMLMGCTVFAVIAQQSEFDAYLAQHTDQVADEIRAASGQPLESWSRWEPLPMSLHPAPSTVPPELLDRMGPRPTSGSRPA